MVGSGALRQAWNTCERDRRCGGGAHDRVARKGDGRSRRHAEASSTHLDEVLALCFCHQRLQLGGGKGVDETRLGHDEEKHLSAGEHRQFICLRQLAICALDARDRNASIGRIGSPSS